MQSRLGCWRHLLGSLVVIVFILGIGVGEARADLSWTCTSYYKTQSSSQGKYNAGYINLRENTGYDAGAAAYCSNATITGSISASITQTDKDTIINGVTGSSVMTNITNKVNQTATNTTYNKNGNNWSAARWAAEGYTISQDNKNLLTNNEYGLQAINTKVSSMETNIGNKITSLESKLQGIETNIQNNTQPIIHKISGINGATAAKGSIDITIDASGVTHYKVGTSKGSGSIYAIEDNALIALNKGVNTIYVEAWNISNSSNKTYGSITIFGL